MEPRKGIVFICLGFAFAIPCLIPLIFQEGGDFIMQKLSSERAQLIASVIGIIIWTILIIILFTALLINPFPTVMGNVISSILLIMGVFFLVSNVRFYLKNKGGKRK